MYIANMNFGNYRIGDEVPENLPHNDERLARGLIREVKVIKPEETKVTRPKADVVKAIKNVIRKSKNETKSEK